MKPKVPLRHALEDANLLGAVLGGESWRAWRILLIAAMGEPLEADELPIFRELTGGREPAGVPAEEIWGVVGRRGGKSKAMGALAVWLAALCDWRDVLPPHEIGTLIIVSPDLRQSSTMLGYCRGALEASPLLRSMLVSETADTLRLSSNIEIECRSANFRRVRGLTCIAVMVDEAAYLPTGESTNPDAELLSALRPALLTTRGPVIVISSPHRKVGEFYESYRDHFGPNGDPAVLVVQGASKRLNPTLDEAKIERALQRDPARGAAEYLAQFRTDLETYVNREVVEAAVVPGRYELAPRSGVRPIAFTDAAGGSGRDSNTIAIAHKEDGKIIIDCVRERRPPFSPDIVTQEFASLLRSYGISSVCGDKYAGDWVSERYRQHGIAYRPSDRVKSAIYGEFLPLLNAGGVELLDHPKLVAQLCSLERRTSRGTSRDSIDHPPNGHDDVANSVAGAAVMLAGARAGIDYKKLNTW